MVLKVDYLELVDVDEHVLMSTMRLDVMVLGEVKVMSRKELLIV